MPNFNIIKKHKPTMSFRVNSIVSTYDLDSENIEEKFNGNIEIENIDWKVGLIVGKSGTGKTTIAKQLFSDVIIEEYTYKADNVLDDMPKSAKMQNICKSFNSVGFSSPPSWLKPYSVLSNGEKMRCDLARSILSDNKVFAFDEFTSVVDRNVAKIGSLAIQKAIRKSDKQFIAITCHHDVEEWLMPDWVFNTDTMTFSDYSGSKKKLQKSSLKFTKQKKNQSIGKCLVNITI